MPKFTTSKKSYLLSNQPHRQIDIDQYTIPNDWLLRLIALCPQLTKNDFAKHIGDRSTYQSKILLKQTLKFHYAVLSDFLAHVDPAFNLTPDQKIAVISKIKEEINACPHGFHARVNALLETYFLPKTIDDLLTAIRHEIVENTANQETNDVHGNNRFFIIANELGYGVQPKLSNDQYFGPVSAVIIREKLKKAFNEAFQPFSTLLYLKDLLITPFDKYYGRNETEIGYKEETYGPGLDYLQQLFNEEARNFEYLIIDEDNSAIRDINWTKVLNKLWILLIEKSYFDFSSWSEYFKSMGFKYIGEITKYILSENIYFNAINTVSEVFEDPTQALLQEEKFKKIPILFSSETECFAYIKCNPELSNNSVITLLLSTLDYSFKNPPIDIEDNFWQFAAENHSYAQKFGQKFFEKYPSKLTDFENEITNPESFATILKKTKSQLYKGLLLKLNYIQPSVLGTSLAELNNSQENMLMLALNLCKNRPEEKQMLIQLIRSLEADHQRKLLIKRNNNDHTFCTLMLIQGQGSSKEAYDLIHLIINMPIRLQYKLSMLKLNKKDQHSGLLLAAKHCPSAVPMILRYYIANVEPNDTQQLISACLADNMLRSKKYKGLWYLLKTIQNVYTLAQKPGLKKAHIAASTLRNELLDALVMYFEHQHQESVYQEFKNKWHASISKARHELCKITEWIVILENLILAVVSIPLLGLPLAINYYRTGYKRLFFQTTALNELDYLDDSLTNKHDFKMYF